MALSMMVEFMVDLLCGGDFCQARKKFTCFANSSSSEMPFLFLQHSRLSHRLT